MHTPQINNVSENIDYSDKYLLVYHHTAPKTAVLTVIMGC